MALKSRWLWPTLCCAALLAAILPAWPFDEAGFEDDWSYGHEALKLAQTGHLHHNGWGGSILLVQSLWAAPWIRLFGFSFQLLQVSTIPFSLGAVLLIYAVGRRVGLSRSLAAFASIGSALSPLLLPFAASFMTESCTCFFGMLCVYCAIRASQAETSQEARRWLWLLAASALTGGANRQIVWAAGFPLILLIAWERRADSRVRLHALAALAVAAASTLAILHFFSPPYGALRLGGTTLTAVALHRGGAATVALLRLLLVVAAMVLPAFACLFRRLDWRLLPISFVLTVAGIFVGAPLAPYGDNMVTPVGIAFGRQDVLGAAFVVLTPWTCLLLTMVVNVCVLNGLTGLRRCRRESTPAARRALRILAVFSLAYLALLVPGAITDIIFDRYMAPLVPLLFLAVMMQAARAGSRPPVIGWACLILISGYAVATTHDHFEQLRAGLRTAHDLEHAGIGRSHISAGMEYDGWTQLYFTDHVRGVDYTDQFADNTAKGFWFEAWDHLPNVQPDYVVLNWIGADPPHGVAASAGFDAWLPPHRRTVVMWKRADLTAELQAARILSESLH